MLVYNSHSYIVTSYICITSFNGIQNNGVMINVCYVYNVSM